MKITTTTGLVGFLLALATLNLPPSEATVNPPTQSAHPTIESRLARLSAAIREQESQLPESTLEQSQNRIIAGGFANRGGGGGFVNRSGGGGFVNRGGGGGFVNANPWRNGWVDGGSFFNNRW